MLYIMHYKTAFDGLVLCRDIADCVPADIAMYSRRNN